MADRDRQQQSFKMHHSVSKHTMVMKRAAADDAERVARRDAEAAAKPSDSAAVSKRLSARLTGQSAKAEPPPGAKTVSGRTVVIRREGDISKRLTVSTRVTGQPTSVRVMGGDTIIRFQSGDMLIKRGARRAALRRQLLWAYAVGYLALFVLYGYFLLTGTTSITPEEYLNKAFRLRHSSAEADLEQAALAAMRGSRTPAEVRFAEPLSFYDADKEMNRIAAGDRLTLATAVRLGKMIIEDQQKPAASRTFAKPFLLYKETYLANLNWPYWLTVYNAIGFFLLILIFLWRPALNYLGTQGQKTAASIRDAREAQEEAKNIREDYRKLEADLGERRERLVMEAKKTIEREHAEAETQARARADAMVGGVGGALAAEAKATALHLERAVALEACRLAGKLLGERLGPEDHDAAIDALIDDVGKMKLAGSPG